MIDKSSSSGSSDSAEVHAFVQDIKDSRRGDGVVDLPWLDRAARRVQDDPGTFLAWMREILRNEETVRDTAKRSYWHPNGFAKMVLHSSADFRIRLHVWPGSDEPSRGESNPHSHRWEFASTIIAGEGVHMAEYTEVVEGGVLHNRYWYGTDPANPAALRLDGQVRIRKLRAPHARLGQIYTCDSEVVHTVRPIDGSLTATLVFQGPHQSAKTVVYCIPGQTDDQPNGKMTEEDVRLLVKSVAAEFAKRQST
ncbi:hypothetical protein SAMN04489729_1892 [Amycolatopsis lurida]|uniref:Cysteine dioxygenase n=1 Tax=Amycolatopsis lurida NRRL 2430 TaxID=1460371 RepID=A0A2P2FGZ9_AMYLU|nr:hypothetical protein [Amycolatopsis lurida]KFU75985.1 hypothetical protein BB31_38385 [Amycolatopsis lurida NRRL 2430]SEC57055.1 hypothetical protein SAMN04489729_1892 [Amycolatopsis lurida]